MISEDISVDDCVRIYKQSAMAYRLLADIHNELLSKEGITPLLKISARMFPLLRQLQNALIDRHPAELAKYVVLEQQNSRTD